MAASSASVHGSGSVHLTATWNGPFKIRDLTIRAIQLVFLQNSRYLSVNLIPMGFVDGKSICQFSCLSFHDSKHPNPEQVARFSTSVAELHELGISIISDSSHPDDSVQVCQLTVEPPERGVLPNSDYMLAISTGQDVSAKLVLTSCSDRPLALQAASSEAKKEGGETRQIIRQALEVIDLCVEEIAPTCSLWVCKGIESKGLHDLMQDIINLGASKAIKNAIPVLFFEWLATTSDQVFKALQYDIDAIALKVPDRTCFAQTLDLVSSLDFLKMLCNRFSSLTDKKHILSHAIESIKLYVLSISGPLESQTVFYLQALLKASGIECRDIPSLEQQVKTATQASIKSLQILIQTVLTLLNLKDGRNTFNDKDVAPLEALFTGLQQDLPRNESLMEIITASASAEEIKKSLELVQKLYKNALQMIVECIEQIALAYGAQAASNIKASEVKAIEAFMQTLGKIEVKSFLQPILSHWLIMTAQKAFEDVPGEELESNTFNPDECLNKLMNPEVVATIQQVFKQLDELVKRPLLDGMAIQRFQKTLTPLSDILQQLFVSYCEEYLPKSKQDAELANNLSIIADQKTKAFMQRLQIITSMSLTLLSLSQLRPVHALLGRHMKPLEALWKQLKAEVVDDDELNCMFTKLGVNV